MRKRNFNFSPAKNLFPLSKKIERGYIVDVIKNIFSFTLDKMEAKKLYCKLNLSQSYFSYCRKLTNGKVILL